MTAPCDGGSGRGPKPGAKPRSAPASTPAPGGHGAPVSCDPAAGGGQPAADLPWHRLQQPWHGAHPARHAHHPALRLHHGAAHAPPAGFFIDLQSWCQFVFEALWGSAASIICSGQALLQLFKKSGPCLEKIKMQICHFPTQKSTFGSGPKASQNPGHSDACKVNKRMNVDDYLKFVQYVQSSFIPPIYHNFLVPLYLLCS